ncbi:hypothetical protein [Frigoriglobus tundricola]|uniref:Uncharacterized protein n=1 Tax=Frigoriglobus tundricola TaxID=2774151 RepID=A0A6M5YFE2_9BACT|nr:hypothetical protein [Frigoriglobus tundricola]QJW92727.1 hypothetical protein FTUN_0224 [Frigoriglobus tundricola]
MTAGRRCRVAAALALVVTMVPLAVSRSKDLDPVKQRDEQKKIKARIDEAARRASSTLDVMMFQRLPDGTEQKMLRDVAEGLRGLSETEIRTVLAHLEKAVSLPAAATEEQKAAYAKHVQVVKQLKVMLGQLDVVKNLDEAAERLERAAEKQIKLVGEAHTNSILPTRRVIVDDREELATEQGDLRTEVGAVFKQVSGLVADKVLTPEQLARVEKAEALPRGAKLAADMAPTADKLRGGNFIDAGERQRRHAKELKDLAAALRAPPGSRIDALKAARAEVEKAIDAQTKVNKDTAEKVAAPEVRNRNGADPKTVRANELANQQAKAEFAARDARKAAEPVAPEAAAMIKPAETQQWKAEDKLRDKDVAGAVEPQEKALEGLKNAKDELDRQIAAAELAKTDPLAATKQAIERVEQLIKEQKQTNAKTEEAADNPARTPEAASAQKDVAKKTDDLAKTPLPPNADAKQALNKALDAQKQAAGKLDKQQPDAAKPDQKDALAALEKAKDALEQQAKAIEERRAEIAKLEELKAKLEDLAKNEKDVARAADKAAADPKKPETGDIAKKQEALTPPTKDVGKELQDLAPDAAKKVDEAGTKQEGAKTDLAMNMPMAGGEKAKDAAAKLDDAAKDVQMKIDEKKGQEATDQAALQPNKVDAQQAAEQLAKAIEQARDAADKAKMAETALDQPAKDKATPDIAQLQKEIAKKATDQKLPDAAKSAEQAAQALDKGDLPKAIENQQKALKDLKAAADMKAQAPMGDKGSADTLAKDQKQLLDATKALQQSQQANAAAQAALQQAQANAPMAVQDQLGKAGEQLGKAGEQLGKGMPGEAGMNQQDAAKGLQQALDALNQAAMAQGMPGAQPGMGQTAMAGTGMQPGMGMGMQPGTGTQPGMGMGMGPPMNAGTSEGDMNGTEKLKNAASSGTAATGDGAFIKMRSKDRDKVQQTGDTQFPAEFRELIKQYNINIKNAKPAAPAPGGK